MDTKMTKKILIPALVIIVLAAAVILYWTRDQEIRFVEDFSDAFEYYASGGNAYIASESDPRKSNITIIGAGSGEYVAIKTWFEKNTNGWKNDINSYAPNRILKSKTLTVNILEKRVVVNYTSDGKSWSQVSKPKAEDDPIF